MLTLAEGSVFVSLYLYVCVCVCVCACGRWGSVCVCVCVCVCGARQGSVQSLISLVECVGLGCDEVINLLKRFRLLITHPRATVSIM